MKNLLPDLSSIPSLAQFVENIGLHYQDYGFPFRGGCALGLLMISPDALTASQIAGALNLNRASLSAPLDLLCKAGMAEVVSVPGERAVRYRVSPQAFQHTLELRLAGMFDLRDLAQQGMEDLAEGDPARKGLERLASFVDLLQENNQEMRRRWQAMQEV